MTLKTAWFLLRNSKDKEQNKTDNRKYGDGSFAKGKRPENDGETGDKGTEKGMRKDLRCVMYMYQLPTMNLIIVHYTANRYK